MTRDELIRDFKNTYKPIIQKEHSKECRQTVLGEVFDGLIRELYKNGKDYVRYWENPYTGNKTDMEV